MDSATTTERRDEKQVFGFSAAYIMDIHRGNCEF